MPTQLRRLLLLASAGAVLVLGVRVAAGEVAPATVWSGTAPSGSCAGNRVTTVVASGATYCCQSGTWAACGTGFPLSGANGGLGQAQPTCSAGQYLSCDGSTCSCTTAPSSLTLMQIGSDQVIGTSMTTVWTTPTFTTVCTVEVTIVLTYASATPTLTFRANTSGGDRANSWYSSKLITSSGGGVGTLQTTADVQAIDSNVWAVTVTSSTEAVWHFFGIVETSSSGTMDLRFQSTTSATVKAGSSLAFACY